MKIIFIVLIVAAIASSTYSFTAEPTVKPSKIETEGIIFKSHTVNGQPVKSDDELETILAGANNNDINSTVHYSKTLGYLSLPLAIDGFLVMGWGLGEMYRGIPFDPYLFGTGAGIVGVSLIFYFLSNMEMNSAIKQYNTHVENTYGFNFEIDNRVQKISVSMRF